MARGQATDFLHNMRFFVDVTGVGGVKRLVPTGRPQAGFTTCSTPELSVDAVEYKEGTFIYSRKYPGNPATGEITLERGVARGDSSFWEWLRQTVEGTGEYRADLQVKHYHRIEALTRGAPPRPAGEPNLTQISIDQPARIYHVGEAFPTQHKSSTDLDGTNGDVSIMSLTLAYEHFEIEELPPPT